MIGHRAVGNDAEDFVADYLVRNGYEIVSRNFHTHWGEIDIIARRNGKWYVGEVKGTQGSCDMYWKITDRKRNALKRAWWEFARLSGVRASPIFLFAFVKNMRNTPRIEILEEEL